jgi:hypothetical protein
MRFIKRWSLAIGSTTRISLAEGVFHDLIVTIGWCVDGGRRVFSFGPAQSKQGTGRCHGRQLEGAQARYVGHEKRWGLTLHNLEVEGSSFCKLTAKETVDGERATVTRFLPALVDSEGGLRWSSGSKVHSGGSGAGGGSSSKHWISARCLIKEDHWQWLVRRRWLSFGSNSHGIRHYL